MTINQLPLTPARWRRLGSELRAELRQVLGGRATILSRRVLVIARDLCQRGRPDVALVLYDALAGQPGAIYGCGFGAMWALKRYMGKRGTDLTATLVL